MNLSTLLKFVPSSKASGAELDTATDDAKFATAKAIKDSHNVPSVAPGTSGNVLTSDGTDWTSAAASGGGTPIGYDTGNTAYSLQLPFILGDATNRGGWTQLPSANIQTIGLYNYKDASVQYMYATLPGDRQGGFYGGKKIRIQIPFRIDSSTPAGDYPSKIGISSSTTIAGDNAFFEINRNPTNFYVKSRTTANNSTYTDNTLTGFTIEEVWNVYELEIDLPNSIKFYVNGVLKATHTTNLPDAGNLYYLIFAMNAGGGSDAEVSVMVPTISITMP